MAPDPEVPNAPRNSPNNKLKFTTHAAAAAAASSPSQTPRKTRYGREVKPSSKVQDQDPAPSPAKNQTFKESRSKSKAKAKTKVTASSLAPQIVVSVVALAERPRVSAPPAVFSAAEIAAQTPSVAPMNTSALHTPLECLFLFQALHQWGVDDSAFQRASRELANNNFVREDETYDAGRLGPEALHGLYTTTLREELRKDDAGVPDGSISASRKKKPQGSNLSVKDAADNGRLWEISQRLHARYKEHVKKLIQQDEEDYERLQREIAEINEGKWDDREEMAIANGIAVMSVDPRTNVTGTRDAPPQDQQPATQTAPGTTSYNTTAPPQIPSRPESRATNSVPNTQESLATPTPQPSQKPLQNALPQNAGMNVQHGPSPVLQQPGMAYKWEPPLVAGHPQPQMYQQAPPYAPYNQHPQQYPPHAYTPQRGPFSPHGPPPPHLQLPSSPQNSQPPNGIPSQSTVPRSPAKPLEALADMAGQQFRAPSGSPMPQGPQTPGAIYAQQNTPQQRPQSRPSPIGPPIWNQQYPPPAQYQMSPNQGASQQTPVHGSPQHGQQQQQIYQGPQQPFYPPQNQAPAFQPRQDLGPNTNTQYSSPYNPNQPRPGEPQPTPGPRQSLPSNLQTPVNQLRAAAYQTGSGTKWTPKLAGDSTPQNFKLIPQPKMELLSPPVQKASLATPPPAKIPNAPKEKKQKSTAKKVSTRGRAGSITPSGPSKTPRSQSLASRIGTPDEPVKEEVNTPANLLDEEMPDAPPDEFTPSQQNPDAISQDNPSSELVTSPGRLKRKRNDSILDTPNTPHEPSKPATRVQWTRNFSKISQSAITEVQRHRHAALFSNPVKERDAPNYSSIVLSPQDIKSIKTAIAAGNKAAQEHEKLLDDPQSGEKSVWLPISEDLIPPKGIINYGQLEQEITRMFANAIMFNPDPHKGIRSAQDIEDKPAGGTFSFDANAIVNESQAMAHEVLAQIGRLRNAEQRVSTHVPVRGSSTVRGSSVARRGDSLVRGESVRGSSVAPTEDEADEVDAEVEVASTTAGSVKSGKGRRRRKG